jgi:iron-sulfur cluster repair protein YtfE (RIC family)
LGQLKPLGALGLRERANEFLEFYRANLVPHFRAEETVLFPPLRETMPGSAPLVDELCRQHEELHRTVPGLESGTGLAKLIFDLADLLERHIRKEERELFPLFETHFDDAAAERIGVELKRILGESNAPRSKTSP